jgi:hypothetical protein
VLRLDDGTAQTALPAPGRRPAILTVRAAHPDGRRLERTVAEPDGDGLLRALLADGWHVEEVAR